MLKLTNQQTARYLFFIPLCVIALCVLLFKAWDLRFSLFLAQEPAPPVTLVANPQPAHQTFTPTTLKAYIKKVNPKVYDRLAAEIVNATLASAKEYNLSAVLVLAVMATESEFNVNAVSKTGARGLMQIQPNYWSETLQKKGILLAPDDIHDPQQNIRAGCYLLRYFLDEQKSFESALSRYLGADSASYRSRVNHFLGEILYFSVQQEINAPYKAQAAAAASTPEVAEASSVVKITSGVNPRAD